MFGREKVRGIIKSSGHSLGGEVTRAYNTRGLKHEPEEDHGRGISIKINRPTEVWSNEQARGKWVDRSNIHRG